MSTQAEAAAQGAKKTLDDQLRSVNVTRQLNLSPEELLNLMRSITPGQIASFRRTVMRMTVDKIPFAEFTIYEFLGFDPAKIVLKFLAVGLHFKMKPAEIIHDIMHIIAINLYMGNLSGNKLERRSDKAKEILARLVATYSIKLGSTGAGLSPETITVPRTSAAFPVLATRMASMIPTTETIGMPFKTISLPRFMRVAAFASFLSHNLEQPTREFLMKCVLAYSCDQTIVFSIDKKTRKPTVDAITAYGRQITYIQASMSSSVPEEWEKGHILQEFKVEDKYQDLQPIVSNLNQLTGLKDSVVSEADFKTHLTVFYGFCQKEKTQREKEETLIIASERAARATRTSTLPVPPPPSSTTAPAAPSVTIQPPTPTVASSSATVPIPTPSRTATGSQDLMSLMEEPDLEGSAGSAADDLYD